MRINSSILNEKRTVGDRESDQITASLFRDKQQALIYDGLKLQANEILLYEKSDEVCQFLMTRKEPPIWFDARRLLCGQRIFEAYAVEIMNLLGIMALPYCYAGSPGNKALHRSDKMRQSPGKRLADTADFIISVCSPGNLTANSIGHVQINKTRLIHSIARYYLLKGEWDMSWGLPINQEDMAGTNLAFSCVTLFGLQKSGIILSGKEKDDFVFLWKYIGYQLGIDEDLLPSSFQESVYLTDLVKDRNFRHSPEGVELMAELLRFYKELIPVNQSKLIESQIRYYLGQEVSRYVGLKPELVKDQVTDFVNALRGLKNILTPHESTFGTMILNHQKLKMGLYSGNKKL